MESCRKLPESPRRSLATLNPPRAAQGTGGLFARVNPSLAALITWVVCLPVAFAAATLGPADPFRLRVAMIPVVVLVVGVLVAGIASRRLPADLASGIGAGLVGGWVAFTLRMALHGTPYGFGGLDSDAGRLAAMANTYSRTWHSSRRDRAVGAVELPAAVPVAGGPHLRADPRACLAAARPGRGHHRCPSRWSPATCCGGTWHQARWPWRCLCRCCCASRCRQRRSRSWPWRCSSRGRWPRSATRRGAGCTGCRPA